MEFYAHSDGKHLTCAWFAMCDNPAEWVARGPVGNGEFDMVPICQRCADTVGMPAEELHEYDLQHEDSTT